LDSEHKLGVSTTDETEIVRPVYNSPVAGVDHGLHGFHDADPFSRIAGLEPADTSEAFDCLANDEARTLRVRSPSRHGAERWSSCHCEMADERRD